MTEADIDAPVSRTAASEAVSDIGWRYLLGKLAVSISQRNRVHFDITVAHDEAEARVRAALDAGGRLVDDPFARSFWVLADAEGNEVCVCTWADRDEREQ